MAPPRSGDRAGLLAYFHGVWEELKKVQWPTRDELVRMTGIVIATVVLFGLLIGGADYVLSLGVKQLYTSSGTSQSSPAQSSNAPAPVTNPTHATPLP